MTPVIRKAILEDLPVLLEFEQELINAERPMDPNIKEGKISYYDISLFIKNKDSDVYVVEADNEIVASGYVKIKKDRHYFKYETIGYLGFMFVPEKHRGNGYNQLIMEALINWCRERKIYEIRLDVYDNNPAAIRAYEKVGMQPYLINMRLNIDEK